MNTQVRWLRAKDLAALVQWGEEAGWFIDQVELERVRRRFFFLAFGAYDGDFFQGGITTYLHEKSAHMGNFIVDLARRRCGIGRRLFEMALEAASSERDCVMLHAALEMVPFYQSYGFKNLRSVGRFVLRQRPKNFSFQAQQARDLESSRGAVLYRLSQIAFGEDRGGFLEEDLLHKSSLILSNERGALHSRVIAGHVFLGPYLVHTAAYMDAELLLRAAIYLRGMKPLVVDAPMDNSDALRLLKQYGFEQTGECVQMSRGKPPIFGIENLYGFATSGSHG